MGARERVLALCNGEMTVCEMAEAAFTDRSYAHRMLRNAHRRRQVHIIGWRTGSTNSSALYMRGSGVDAIKPKITSTMRVRAMLERMSADDRDRWRNRTNARRRKVKQDPLVRVFFGG